MSGPQSLREARTKRQKAKVYKTSRSEFRSTLNPTRSDHSPEQEGSEQGDDKVTRRKIMKLEEKSVGAQTEGEGSVEMKKVDGKEKVPNKESDPKEPAKDDGKGKGDKKEDDKKKDDEGNDDEGNDDEGNDDEGNDDEGNDDEDNDDDEKKKKKKDDDSDDDSGNNDFNMKEGDEDNEDLDDDLDDLDDLDSSNDEEASEKDSQIPDKEDDGENAQDNKEREIDGNVKEFRVGLGDDVIDIKKADIDDGDEDSFHYNFISDPYEEDFDEEDDPSIEEDYYEFLSQDGGSGLDSNYEEDEDEEIRSAG